MAYRRDQDDDLDLAPEERPRGSLKVGVTRRREREPIAVEDDGDALDNRALDLEPEEEPSFLRAQKRIPVRRGPLPKKAVNRLRLAVIALAVLVVAGTLAALLYSYGTGSWRFRIDSSDNIEVSGMQSVTRAQVMEIFGGDIGRNIFFVSLAERQRQLQEIPWVESATVMRLLPNRLKIQIKERTPVAFVRIGSKASLIDSSGVLLDMPLKPAGRYSFPLITGIADNEPLSSRAASMKIFTRFMQALDVEGSRYSQTISEADLSDPEDVKATIADSAGAVLVHLGDVQFLERYKLYLAHVEEWRQQYPRLESVDLRYDRQVVLNPDSAQQSSAKAAAQSAAPTKSPAKPSAKTNAKTKAQVVGPPRH